MSEIKTYEGDLVARGARIAIVASRFNEFIVGQLVAGAEDALKRHGVEERDIHLARVPGAWELPLIARRLAETRRYDAIVALGCVIRGATPHFDYVCGAAARGLAEVQMTSGLPVIFGVLTTDNIEQAIERAGTKAGNKGADAALAALEMVDLMKRVEA